VDNQNIKQKELFNPRILLKDIILGFSFFIDSLTLKRVYIKHSNNLDGAESEEIYNVNFEKAINNGLITNTEQLEYLKLENVWNEKEEYEIKDQEKFIDTMKITKTKLYQEAQIKQVNDGITDAQNKINNLIQKKDQLIGFTAEKYAIKKQNEFFIYNSLYKAEDLKEKYFTFEEYNNLEETKLLELIKNYNNKSTPFNNKNIQKLALEPLFLNGFSLCDNDPYKYYGKPTCYLTYYQIELFSYGCNFKHILSELKDKIDPELYKDPEKLTEYYNSTKNIEEVVNRAGSGQERDGGAIGIVGKKSDINKIRDKTTMIVDPVISKLKKQGHVSFNEVLELQPPDKK